MGLKVVKYYLRQPCSICFEDQGYPFRKGCQMSMLIAIIVRIWRQSKMNPISYNWFYIENGQCNINRVLKNIKCYREMIVVFIKKCFILTEYL